MAKLVFITNKVWPSSKIRGQQLAEATGGICDPKTIEYGDTLVLVKIFPTNIDFLGRFNNVYADVVDGDSILEMVRHYPHINIIAISELAKQYIECRVKNKVILIPEHHCNFDNEVRDSKKKIETVGFVGSINSLDLDPIILARELRKVGLNFAALFCDDTNVTREDVVEFYKNIDIQVCFRLPRLLKHMPPEMKNPLKIYNAGSFKIPTVSYPELNYVKECPDAFFEASSVDRIAGICSMLVKERATYNGLADRAYKLSKSHHINIIAKKYEEFV